MSPLDAAQAVSSIIAGVTTRIVGIGAEQYSRGDRQKFEDMPLVELVEYAREEALDLVAYGAFLEIRLARVQTALARLEREIPGQGRLF